LLRLTTLGIAMGAVTQVLVPEEFRGRMWGIMGSRATSLIPLASLIGGFLADKFGPVPLVSVADWWILATALLGGMNKHIRNVRIA
jgi:MFS family permease